MPLFHREIGFPKQFVQPKGTFKLEYSQHASKAAASDRFGNLTQLLPGSINTAFAELIEAELDRRNRPVKLVYRMSTAAPFDLVLVCSTDCNPWFVRTVWANRSDDHHSTLDKSKYMSADAA